MGKLTMMITLLFEFVAVALAYYDSSKRQILLISLLITCLFFSSLHSTTSRCRPPQILFFPVRPPRQRNGHGSYRPLPVVTRPLPGGTFCYVRLRSCRVSLSPHLPPRCASTHTEWESPRLSLRFSIAAQQLDVRRERRIYLRRQSSWGRHLVSSR